MNCFEEKLLIERLVSLYQPLWAGGKDMCGVNEYIEKFKDKYRGDVPEYIIEKMTEKDMAYRTKLYSKMNNRFKFIESNVDFGSTFLDVGCNIGFNSFKILENGGYVLGVDASDLITPNHICQKYGYSKSKIEFVSHRFGSGRSFEIPERIISSKSKKFDYGICLLVLHHSLDKDVNSTEFFKKRAILLIKELKEICSEIFFQLRLMVHYPKEIAEKLQSQKIDKISRETHKEFGMDNKSTVTTYRLLMKKHFNTLGEIGFDGYLKKEFGFDEVNIITLNQKCFAYPHSLYKCR